MSVLGTLTGIITAGAGGGLFGIVGQLANRGLGIWELKERRQDAILANAQEEKRWAHEGDLLKLQMQAKTEESEQELSIAATQGAWSAFGASQQAEAAIGHSYPWVEAVRGLTRPILTLESQVMLAIVFFAIKSGRADLQTEIVETVTFCASASLLWWFGERAQKRSNKA